MQGKDGSRSYGLLKSFCSDPIEEVDILNRLSREACKKLPPTERKTHYSHIILELRSGLSQTHELRKVYNFFSY